MRDRVYVQVTSVFDVTGHMKPRCITWADGREFTIDEVVCQRNARKLDVDINGHCYIVKIQGKERFLFYEKMDPMYAAQTGRWFVEK